MEEFEELGLDQETLEEIEEALEEEEAAMAVYECVNANYIFEETDSCSTDCDCDG